MPKNTKPAKTSTSDKALAAVLAELKAARTEIRQLTSAQKKTSKELHAIKKALNKGSFCKFSASKKKKKSSRKPKSDNAGPDAPLAMENGAHQTLGIANTLSGPMDGAPDDLKWISGVGPKLEVVLNDLGVYHFEQIAAWNQTEIDWVDDYLKFSGRIERDNWIGQAKALAKGGWDEYVKVFGKEPR